MSRQVGAKKCVPKSLEFKETRNNYDLVSNRDLWRIKNSEPWVAKATPCDCIRTKGRCGNDCKCWVSKIVCSVFCGCFTANVSKCGHHFIRTNEGVDQRLEVFKTDSMGDGIRAARDFGKHEFLTTYVGEMVKGSDYERKVRSGEYSNAEGHHYSIYFDDEFVFDATRYGSISRLINHACPSKRNVIPELFWMDSLPIWTLWTNRPVKKKQEFFYNYRFSEFKNVPKFVCLCMAPECPGRAHYQPRPPTPPHPRQRTDMEGRHPCRIFGCPATLDTEAHRDEHEAKVHGSERFYCNICHKDYKTKQVLLSHRLSVHGVKWTEAENIPKRICPHCGKAFIAESLRDNHIPSCLNLREFPCQYCPKRFNTKKNCTDHEKTHLNWTTR